MNWFDFMLKLLENNIGAFFAFLMFLLLKHELAELRKEISQLRNEIHEINKDLLDLLSKLIK